MLPWLIQASTLWNPALVALYPSLAAASVVINTLVWRQASMSTSAAGSTTTAAGVSSSALVAIPSTGGGWTYAIFALLYVLTAAACYAPEVLFVGDLTPTSALLKHTWAPGFLLAGLSCLMLRGAADRGRLGASTFR